MTQPYPGNSSQNPPQGQGQVPVPQAPYGNQAPQPQYGAAPSQYGPATGGPGFPGGPGAPGGPGGPGTPGGPNGPKKSRTGLIIGIVAAALVVVFAVVILIVVLLVRANNDSDDTAAPATSSSQSSESSTDGTDEASDTPAESDESMSAEDSQTASDLLTPTDADIDPALQSVVDLYDALDAGDPETACTHVLNVDTGTGYEKGSADMDLCTSSLSSEVGQDYGVSADGFDAEVQGDYVVVSNEGGALYMAKGADGNMYYDPTQG